MGAQVANMLTHFLRAGRTVKPDAGHLVVRFQCHHRSSHIGAHQHRARRLNRDGAQDEDVSLLLDHGVGCARDRRLGLEDVLAGLDQQSINATVKQTADLLVVADDQPVPACLQQGG